MTQITWTFRGWIGLYAYQFSSSTFHNSQSYLISRSYKFIKFIAHYIFSLYSYNVHCLRFTRNTCPRFERRLAGRSASKTAGRPAVLLAVNTHVTLVRSTRADDGVFTHASMQVPPLSLPAPAVDCLRNEDRAADGGASMYLFNRLSD